LCHNIFKDSERNQRGEDNSSLIATYFVAALSGLEASAGELVTMEEAQIFQRRVGFSTNNLKEKNTNDFATNLCRKTPSFMINYASFSEKSFLLQQLNHLRRKRRLLEKNASPALHRHLCEWKFRVSFSQQYYLRTLSKLETLSSRKNWTEEEYQFTSRWHVLGDVFLIWHRGPFGTINGFRLGKSASTIVGLVEKCAVGGDGSPAGQLGTGGGASLFSWDNGTAPFHAPKIISANITVSRATNLTAMQKKVMVPWNEINSALGQLLFLLYTLQNAPHSGINFRNHILQPCGSASKIGVIKKLVVASTGPPKMERRRITALAAYYKAGTTDAAPNSISQPLSQLLSNESHPSFLVPNVVTWYNLHHYEENGSLLSMGYYARRNFNTALEGLLYCLVEACLVVEKRDMALTAPHIMRIDGLVVGKDGHGNKGIVGNNGIGGNNGLATLGGLPLAYDPAAGEQWTLVCKYLITNLKWLIAYAAKHIDR
jgi:hypothetical protein